MSDVAERLKSWGADVDGAMKRMLNDKELYMSLLGMLIEESEATKLYDSIKNMDYEMAFTYAHSLKGVLGNLGLVPIHNPVCKLVDKLRTNDFTNLEDIYCEIMRKNDELINILKD